MNTFTNVGISSLFDEISRINSPGVYPPINLVKLKRALERGPSS